MKDDLPKKISEILGKNHRGCHYITSGGASFTVNIADDPIAKEGKYVSVTDNKGRKRTVVFDKSGRIVKDTGWK